MKPKAPVTFCRSNHALLSHVHRITESKRPKLTKYSPQNRLQRKPFRWKRLSDRRSSHLSYAATFTIVREGRKTEKREIQPRSDHHEILGVKAAGHDFSRSDTRHYFWNAASA